jgi:hypothetical protein
MGMRFAHLVTAGAGGWDLRMHVMRFAHHATAGAGGWDLRMHVMRFAPLSGRPAAKWENRMLEPTHSLTCAVAVRGAPR